jgi:hypothetical protein
MHGGNLETVNELAEAGANVNADWCGETVLMAAAAGGNLPIVKRLIELGAKLAARDKSRGMSVMDHAKASKNKELIAYLKTLGAAADRDAPRALARSLARKYGGKPVEHVAGFMLNAKFHGQSCQFNIGTEGLSLFVRGLDYGAPEFKRSKDGQLILATAKPNNQRLKFEAVVRGAGDKAGLVVFRTLGVSPLPEAFVKSFYSDHIKHFEQLRLSKQETVNLGSNSAGFSCSRVDVAFVEQRLEAFAQLIHKISRPPQPERTWFDGERLMKSGPRTGAASSHQFGGTYEQPIACPQCGCATNLMVRVDFSDPLLPKTMLGRDQFPVFWCLACLEWDPVFYELPSPTPQALNKSGQRLKPLKVKQGEEDLPARVLTLVPVASGKKAGRKSKLGGKPTWIQMDQTPDCPKCENPMAFVLQLASDSRISYGDMGMLYSFVCPECHVSAALIQSH